MIIKESDLKKFNDGLLSYVYFFSSPSVRDIKKNSMVKANARYKGDVIEKIMNLNPDEFLFMKGSILPRAKDKNGNLYQIKSDEFDKKYKEFKIKIPRTFKEAQNSKSNPQNLILSEIKNKKQHDVYRGYGWRPESDRTFRLIPLNMIFRGLVELYFFTPEIYSNNESAEKLYYYLSKKFGDSDYKIHSEDYGRNAIVYVPSLSKNQLYKFKIENIPLTKDNEKDNKKYLRWTDTKISNHNCDYTNYFSLREKYRNGIIIWCNHGVAGFNFLKWKSQKGEYNYNPKTNLSDKIYSNIFIIPNENDMKFYDNLNKVIIYDGIKNRPLTIAEKEALLWVYTFKNKDSFVHKKGEIPLSSYIIKIEKKK